MIKGDVFFKSKHRKNSGKRNDNLSIPVTKNVYPKAKPNLKNRFTAQFLMASPPVTGDRGAGKWGVLQRHREFMLLLQSRTLWQTG